MNENLNEFEFDGEVFTLESRKISQNPCIKQSCLPLPKINGRWLMGTKARATWVPSWEPLSTMLFKASAKQP